jgi:hypothetical protein
MSVCGPYSNRSPTRRGRTQRTAGSPRQYEDYHDSAYLPYLKRLLRALLLCSTSDLDFFR